MDDDHLPLTGWDVLLANLFAYGSLFCIILFFGIWLLIGLGHAVWLGIAGIALFVGWLLIRLGM